VLIFLLLNGTLGSTEVECNRNTMLSSINSSFASIKTASDKGGNSPFYRRPLPPNPCQGHCADDQDLNSWLLPSHPPPNIHNLIMHDLYNSIFATYCKSGYACGYIMRRQSIIQYGVLVASRLRPVILSRHLNFSLFGLPLVIAAYLR